MIRYNYPLLKIKKSVTVQSYGASDTLVPLALGVEKVLKSTFPLVICCTASNEAVPTRTELQHQEDATLGCLEKKYLPYFCWD